MRKQAPSASTSTAAEPQVNAAQQRTNYFVPLKPSSATGVPSQASSAASAPSAIPNGNGCGNITVNGATNNATAGNALNQAPEDPVANYTLQGVMQWLNGEYRRYERDRNAWEIERAGLIVSSIHAARNLIL